ncbi:MAG: adenylate/guanylate cyclase domain-containing protein [Planctomycetales bacterium]|nr:adenylate/guanylate cyclase domain-containing protein [Planctomycetales bacterium]
MPYQLTIYDQRKPVASFSLSQPIEIGRQDMTKNEPAPQPEKGEHVARVDLPDRVRLIVAGALEKQVSRQHLRLEPQPGDKVLVTNLSANVDLSLGPHGRLAAKESRICDLPLYCDLLVKAIRLEGETRASEEFNMQTLAQPALAPGRSSIAAAQPMLQSLVGSSKGLTSKQSADDVLCWLQGAMDVLQSAASSPDYLHRAAASAVRLIDLDVACVLQRRAGEWHEAASEIAEGCTLPKTWRPSRTMLERVLDNKRTVFHPPQGGQEAASRGESLQSVRSLVAAPILDREGEVIAVLYGERRNEGILTRCGTIDELQARLFELLAYGVAAGLARAEQERQVLAERVRFEQFFTPELAGMLQTRGEEMLSAKSETITVLFCDINGFSRISAEKDPQITIEWLRDVLSLLSDCVAEERGVLIDYSGDALEAIWGAPEVTPDHAVRACRAALKMKAELAEFNTRWEPRLGEPTGISIGINSGPAQVGNIGSRRKIKYGAFGPTVNQAARVQGATKLVGCPLLVTKGTADLLGGAYSLRRLCTATTVNIAEPVDFYELPTARDAAWPKLKEQYEQALALFESARFRQAMALLINLAGDFPTDVPTMNLLQRSMSLFQNPPAKFDPVWHLKAKTA